MMERLVLRITALAERQIRTSEEWWRVNRTAAPHAVRQELERAFSLIRSQPRIGSRASNVRLPSVRRIYLPPALEGIRNARTVHEIIRRAQKAAA